MSDESFSYEQHLLDLERDGSEDRQTIDGLEREIQQKDAQIAALRGENIAMRDACNVALKTGRGEALSDHALTCLGQALSSPPPPVVPLEKLQPLFEAFKTYSVLDSVVLYGAIKSLFDEYSKREGA